MTFTFTTGRAGWRDILVHLRACDRAFVPSLSSRVDLEVYARKIHAQGTTFEAWSGSVLVSLVGGYFNRPEAGVAFVTTVSTLPEANGKGCARRLMTMALDHGMRLGFETVELEVGAENQKAQRLYESLGFQSQGRQNEMVIMKWIRPVGPGRA